MNKRTLPPSAADLAACLREHLPELRKKYAIRSLDLFGSYLRNEQTPESDVDILLDLDDRQPMSLLRFIQLENELSDLLGKRVDLVEKSALKPVIGQRILAEVAVL